VGHRAGLDGCGKSRPHWDSIPGPSIPYRVAIQTELSRLNIRTLNQVTSSRYAKSTILCVGGYLRTYADFEDFFLSFFIFFLKNNPNKQPSFYTGHTSHFM
jgi:hypothetical protein